MRGKLSGWTGNKVCEGKLAEQKREGSSADLSMRSPSRYSMNSHDPICSLRLA